MKVIINFVYAIIGFAVYMKQYKKQNVDIKPTKENYIRSIQVNNNTLDVHYIPDMNKLGLMFAAFVKPIAGKTFFVVDTYFMNFPQDYQEAILQHEAGHIACGHANHAFKKAYESFVLLGRQVISGQSNETALYARTLSMRKVTEEYQADEYAANMHNVEATLGVLRLFAVMVHDTESRQEIFNRYEHITGSSMIADGTFAVIRNAFLEGVRSAVQNAPIVSLDSVE
jgi:hypothetical protein